MTLGQNFLLLLGLLLSSQVLAWGEKGHRTVALIAYQQLNAQTQARVDALLAHKGFADIGDASVWPDKVREQKLPEYAHTGPWHYVNLPRGSNGFDMQRDCSRPCIVSALAQMLEQLSSHSPDAQAEALAFVVHLVGDLHQPLHVSFADDRGGNDRKVMFDEEPVSLHYYWDSLVLKSLPQSDLLAAQLLDAMSTEQRQNWLSADVNQWLAESYAITATLYQTNPAVIDPVANQHYQQQAKQRIVQAGLRLASLLNKYLPE
ncbi:S1/P1 nuclease [Bowmanella denitrificans]|uniref:S1/P1 nuclease n=1 Tax=Bowmanella denitrificans TaxID=366582 RepID=UPI000C9C0FDE|nr:S1/P1 nuclease [Bowmanella denitrificans]